MRVKDEDKVTRIYRAAIKVINLDGFQGCSMTKIATEAGLSPATIYLYFENKDDMIKKLFIYLKSKMGNSYFSQDTDLSPSKGTFRTIWLNHYQYIMDNMEEYHFLENFSNCPLIEHVDKENKHDYCPAFETSPAAFKQSPQWLTKNCFSFGRNVSAVPMMGRSAVVICTATSRKMMTHVWKPACDRAFEWENPTSKNRSPKMVAMNQKTRCNVPIQASDSVDCEKIHATGAKPMRPRLSAVRPRGFQP